MIEKLSDMDVIDISGINSLPYVNIIYDYIGNDAYAAQKAVNTSEAVVVVTESSDGSLSPDMSQLINDISSSIPVMLLFEKKSFAFFISVFIDKEFFELFFASFKNSGFMETCGKLSFASRTFQEFFPLVTMLSSI